MCRSLAARGAQVAFTWHTGEDEAQQLSKEMPDSPALQLDVRRIDDLERTIDEAARALGGIDAFVHCIGVSTGMDMRNTRAMEWIDETAWDDIIKVNVKSVFFACRRLLPIMRSNAVGNIVIIGSIDGVKPLPVPVHYAASKAALGGITRAMAKELGGDGVLVNMVAPGIMEGGLSRTLPQSQIEEYEKFCGLKRVGRFAEIANLITWLALENTYITGQTIVVDGAL